MQFAIDAEQLADEVFELGRKRDDEFGLVLAGDGVRRRARGEKPIMQSGVRLAQEGDERGIEPHETVAAIQVIEARAKAERQFWRQG